MARSESMASKRHQSFSVLPGRTFFREALSKSFLCEKPNWARTRKRFQCVAVALPPPDAGFGRRAKNREHNSHQLRESIRRPYFIEEVCTDRLKVEPRKIVPLLFYFSREWGRGDSARGAGNVPQNCLKGHVYLGLTPQCPIFGKLFLTRSIQSTMICRPFDPGLPLAGPRNFLKWPANPNSQIPAARER